MKNHIALTCACILSFVSHSIQASELPLPSKKPVSVQTNPYESIEHLKISREGDVEMHCGALSEEAARMRDIIYQMENVKNKSKMKSHGVTAAGALGSFLIGTVTGGVGLAVGGFLIDQNITEGKEQADDIQDTAEQRRTLMMGIFNAKGCEGPIEHAMQNPEDLSTIDMIASIEPASGNVYQTELRRRYNP